MFYLFNISILSFVSFDIKVNFSHTLLSMNNKTFFVKIKKKQMYNISNNNKSKITLP